MVKKQRLGITLLESPGLVFATYICKLRPINEFLELDLNGKYQ